MDYARKIANYHKGPQHRTNLKLIDRFNDVNRVNSNNFNDTVFKFHQKLDHAFLHVFIFGNMFPESYSFVVMPVTSCIKDTCAIYPYLM